MNHDLDLLISFLQPIKELLLDDTVSEIMGNPNGEWWFERKGRLEHAEVIFDAKALRTGLEVIANKLSRKFDEAHPLLNAQLPDGSRLAAVLPPVVRPNPAVTIRKFSKIRFTIADLGTINRAVSANVNLYGYLVNTSTTLALTTTTGSWTLQSGVIAGGTITTSGSGVLIGGNGTLDGVFQLSYVARPFVTAQAVQGLLVHAENAAAGGEFGELLARERGGGCFDERQPRRRIWS